MSVSQISVFSESKPGHLLNILDIFENAHVNVRGYAVSDTGEYGIARFIVDKPEDACDALRQAGAAFTLTQVLCLKLDDKPGELARVIGMFADCGINISYSYSMISTYIVIKTSDIDKAKGVLDAKHVSIISQSDISNADFS